jgi:hypothetical protein
MVNLLISNREIVMSSLSERVRKQIIKNNIQSVKKIKDINDQFNYKDEIPGGKKDSPLVSCGQSGDYNELKYIYNEYLADYVNSGEFTEEEAVKSLASACFNLKNPRQRSDFYNHVESQLGVENIFPK